MSRDQKLCYRKIKTVTCARKKTPWKLTNLQNMNVCQILNRNESHSGLPLTLKTTRKRIDIDFERVSIVCALAQLTKTQNAELQPGGFSYAIQEKFYKILDTRLSILVQLLLNSCASITLYISIICTHANYEPSSSVCKPMA